MDNYSDAAKPVKALLYTLWQSGFVAETLSSLIDLAEVMNGYGKTEQAANAVAFVMNHPDVPFDTFDRAEELWFDLELHVCPRVLTDAKAWGSVQTLRGVVEAAVSEE